jgi:hypothetical protein
MPKSKRKRRSNSASGYIGVTLTKSKRYQAKIKVDGKLENIGTYGTAKQAAKAYDAAAIELGRPLSKLNFPKKVPPGYTPTNNGQRSDNMSGYRGVSKWKDGYQAEITIKGKKTFLGLFNTCKQAAIAYNYAVHKHRLPKSQLNFPTMKHNLNKEPQRKKQKVSSSPLDSEVYKRHRQAGTQQDYWLKKRTHLLAPSTLPKKQHLPTTKLFSNTTNPSKKLNFPPQTNDDEIQIKEEPKDDQISSNSEWV